MARRLRPLLFSTLLALFPAVSSRAQDEDLERSVASWRRSRFRSLALGVRLPTMQHDMPGRPLIHFVDLIEFSILGMPAALPRPVRTMTIRVEVDLC